MRSLNSGGMTVRPHQHIVAMDLMTDDETREALRTSPDAPRLRYQKLAPDVVLPKRETIGAAGRDVRAYLTGSRVKLTMGDGIVERGPDCSEDTPFIRLLPGQLAIIPTGFKIAVPAGYEVQVRPRSETSFKKRLVIPNAPDTIDPDYRGEVGVIVKNDTLLCMNIEHGERIAQFVVARVADLEDAEVELLDETPRGDSGFSTAPGYAR